MDRPVRFSTPLPAALTGAGLASLLLVPAAALCEEVTIGLDFVYVHDSNFYGTQSDEEAADSVEVGGNISVQRRQGRLRYLASYSGAYQKFRKQDDADAPEHRLRLRGSYDIDPLTTFQINNRFRDIRSLRFSREDIRDGDSGLLPNNDRYQRNDLDLSLHRDITRSWELEINARHQFIDFENNVNRSDSESVEIGARLFYRFAHATGSAVAFPTCSRISMAPRPGWMPRPTTL